MTDSKRIMDSIAHLSKCILPMKNSESQLYCHPKHRVNKFEFTSKGLRHVNLTHCSLVDLKKISREFLKYIPMQKSESLLCPW